MNWNVVIIGIGVIHSFLLYRLFHFITGITDESRTITGGLILLHLKSSFPKPLIVLRVLLLRTLFVGVCVLEEVYHILVGLSSYGPFLSYA